MRIARTGACALAALAAGCSLDLGRLRGVGALDAGTEDARLADAGQPDDASADAGDTDAAGADTGPEADAGPPPVDGGACAAACAPDGRFGTAIRMALAGTAAQVELGDVTGDGLLDIVVRESGGSLEVFTLPRSGACRGRALEAVGGVATTAASASSFALGDVTGDGDDDAVVVSTSGVIEVFAGGAGGLSVPTASSTFPGNGFGVALTGSRIDVAVGGAAGAIHSFRFEGGGLVELGVLTSDPLVENASLRLVGGEAAVVSLVLTPSAALVDRIGPGGALVRFATVSLPAAGGALGVGDLDGDGGDDIVTNGIGTTRLTMLLGSATGFTVAPRADAGDVVHALAVHPLDDDSRADIAVLAGALVLPYLVADPTLAGGALVGRPSVALAGDGDDIAVGDLDRDGLPDLVVVGDAGGPDELRWVPGACP